MNIVPAPRTPIGEPSDADRTRAADRLSVVLGRDVRPDSWAAHQLAVEYAQAYAAGYEQAQRDGQAATC